jgi:hypothetical protein
MFRSNSLNSVWFASLFLLGLGMVLAGTPVQASDDSADAFEEARLSRLSYISGELLFQRGDEDEDWVASSINMPLRPHDKFWSTEGTKAELEMDNGAVIRLAENSQMTLLALEKNLTQIQLTLGRATITTRDPSIGGELGATLEIDTPQAVIIVDQRSRFRLEVREDGSTEITVREGRIRLSTDTEPVWITKNQRIVIDSDENPHYFLESPNPIDDWDVWNDDRDRQRLQSVSQKYLPPSHAMGYSELDQFGTWSQISPYGWVWAPQVSVGWVPYQNGRWIWIEPWGWTWVSYEPWGWMPFHYGRWIVISGSWIWVPGHRQEVWSPGHVRFIHGPDWVAWVPLAPGEPYYDRPRGIRPVNSPLINYRVPGATTILPRNAFVSGTPVPKNFTPPHDPIKSGRLIAGPLPLIPTHEGLRPRPEVSVRSPFPPSRLVHRPVTYNHPVLNPPQRFDRRIEEIKETIEKGNPPHSLTPQNENIHAHKGITEFDRERIYKDRIVRKPTQKMEDPPQVTHTPSAPVVKRFDQKKGQNGKAAEVKSLYRKPPRSINEREIK